MPRRSWFSRDGKFGIVWDEMSGGMTTYEDQFAEDWTVIVVATGEKLKRFDGDGLRTHPEQCSGVRICDFNKWQDAVVAVHYDGTVETLPLPGATRPPWWRRLLG